MEYKGKLYGKLWNKYFDTGKTADDWDNLEKNVKQEAVKFAEWLRDNAHMDLHGKWVYFKNAFEPKTEEQLYEQFKKEQDGSDLL